MDTADQPQVNVETADGVAWVRFNRPERLNAFTPESYRRVREAIRIAEADETVDVIVLTGIGQAFSTGADLKAFEKAMTTPGALGRFEFEDSIPFDTIRDCGTVTVAAVNGYCFGAGMVIVGLCDIVVAAQSATFSIPEGTVGIADPFVPAALFTKLSTTHLKYLALTAERIPAADACQMGLVAKVVPDPDLVDAVHDVISAVRRTTPTARRFYKQFINDLLPRANVRDMHPPLLAYLQR